MSKRFGRQQKKKARLEIEMLNNIVNLREKELTGIKRSVHTTVEAAKNIIETVRSICPNSVFLEKSRIDMNHYMIEPIPKLCSPLLMNSYKDSLRPIDIRRIDLYDLEISMSDTEFQDAVHFELALSSPYEKIERACYRISKEGFKHTPKEFIVNELVDHLKRSC